MKTLIIFDSRFGNTEKIARAICDATNKDAEILRVGEVNSTNLDSVDLLIIGSPYPCLIIA